MVRHSVVLHCWKRWQGAGFSCNLLELCTSGGDGKRIPFSLKQHYPPTSPGLEFPICLQCPSFCHPWNAISSQLMILFFHYAHLSQLSPPGCRLSSLGKQTLSWGLYWRMVSGTCKGNWIEQREKLNHDAFATKALADHMGSTRVGMTQERCSDLRKEDFLFQAWK